jgi:hypothetical protein
VQRAGVRHVWLTFAGLESTHDALVGRPGAFAANIAALERCRTVGLETGANIIVSTRNTSEIGELAQRIRALGAERFVPTYVQGWTPLGDAYERIRPEPADLAGLPPAGLDVNWGYAEFWAEPEAYTEGALTRAAIQGRPPHEADESSKDDSMLGLLVDARLDVWTGELLAPPLQRVGNLRDQTPAALYQQLAGLARPPEPPADAELAERYGDGASQKVHMGRFSVRRKWVTAWRAEQAVGWLMRL